METTMNANNDKIEINVNESDGENDWYFGSITRSEAQNILIINGLTEGLFLIRKSVSSPEDYVLSCVHNSSVFHCQIRRVGVDPFFTIGNEVPIHGLDSLIKHFRNLSQNNESAIVLRNHCRCVSPPPDTQRHGRTNLLHRSVACAEHRIVYELLRAKDRLNLNARNEKGRTALHLSMYLDERKHLQIVEQLIKAGAYVDCKDSESITPLHLCAKLNKPNFAKLLIVEGKAITFGRTSDQSWVALHFAAYFANIEVMKVLLDLGSAPQPRDSSNETPTDIALKYKHLKCKKLCDFYSNRPLNHFIPRNQWLCEHITNKSETNRLFEMSEQKDGLFLVRKSRTKQNTYVLAMAYNQRVYNFEIQNINNLYFIDTGPLWPSLEHLISYHILNSDGLPSRLRAPVPSIQSFIDISIDKKLIQSNTKNNRHLDWSHKSGCNENNNESIKSILFIDNNELRTDSLIGSGEYGDVFKGTWIRANRVEALVAIKILRKQDVHIRQKIDNFLKEVEVMTSAKHPNIIRLLGVCIGQPLMMIQELAPLGNIHDFLINHPNEVDISHDIKLWSTQIALAMKYLEDRHFVHRDLAARNVLLVTLHLAKISDFGLSRALNRGQQTYEASVWDRWPIRWYAPESIKYGIFTHASDVWSYGVVLWEMYSFGDELYRGVEDLQIIKFIESGKRLSKPYNCTDMVFALISLCWSLEPKNRPSFKEIVEMMFNNDCEYESIRDELKSVIQM